MHSAGTTFLGDPTPLWHDLKFNAVGLAYLRQKLGRLESTPGIYERYQPSFDAADIAWFAAGLHNDGNHIGRPNTFHPMFLIGREHSPKGEQGNKERNALRERVRSLIFDLVSFCCRSQTIFISKSLQGNYVRSYLRKHNPHPSNGWDNSTKNPLPP